MSDTIQPFPVPPLPDNIGAIEIEEGITFDQVKQAIQDASGVSDANKGEAMSGVSTSGVV